MDKGKLTFDSMLSYLKNLFSNSERHALEKEVMKDPFEAEAFEGLSELSADAFKSDIQNLQAKLNERTSNKKAWFLNPRYAIAASVLFLLGLGLTMILLNKTETPKNIVTNTQDIEGAVVVVNDSEADKESRSEELFKEPDVDFNEEVESTVAYEEVEADVPADEIVKPMIEVLHKKKKSSLSNTITPVPNGDSIYNLEKEELISAKDEEVEVAKVETEVTLEKEAEFLDALKIGLNVIESKKETLVGQLDEMNTWTGTITDNYGMPLPGVSVIIKDSDVGTVTDFDGNYTLQVPKDAEVEAVYLGFEETTVVYGSHQKVILDEDGASLEEVVVVGYGTRKKRKGNLGKVQAVKRSRINKRSEVDEALKGKVAGINIADSKINLDEKIIKRATSPQGSDEAFKRWLMTQLDPSQFENGKEYNITIHFMVNKEGGLFAFETNTDLKNSEKEHVKNKLLSSAKWEPAQNKNGAIKESKTLVLWFHF